MSEEKQSAANRLMRSANKEGERILGPTRRPDGTLRKPVRIRAGYTPQDEVAVYQSKGILQLRKAQPDVPPGFDVEAAEINKPKTKSAKRNEKRKEKKIQAAVATSDNKEAIDSDQTIKQNCEDLNAKTQQRLETVETVTNQILGLSVSSTSEVDGASSNQNEASKCGDNDPNIDKKIRALKKKIRLAEAQVNGDPQNMKSEHLEKMAKIGGWRDELKVLEDKYAKKNSSDG